MSCLVSECKGSRVGVTPPISRTDICKNCREALALSRSCWNAPLSPRPSLSDDGQRRVNALKRSTE